MQSHKMPGAHRPKTSSVEVVWKAVSYRTVAIYLVLFFVAVMAALYLIYPESYASALSRIWSRISLVEAIVRGLEFMT